MTRKTSRRAVALTLLRRSTHDDSVLRGQCLDMYDRSLSRRVLWLPFGGSTIGFKSIELPDIMQQCHLISRMEIPSSHL